MNKSPSKTRVQGRARCKPAPLRPAEGKFSNTEPQPGQFSSPSSVGRCPGISAGEESAQGRARRRRERNKVGPNLRPQGLVDVCCQLPFPPLLLHPFSSHPKLWERDGTALRGGRTNRTSLPKPRGCFRRPSPPPRPPRPAITANHHLTR